MRKGGLAGPENGIRFQLESLARTMLMPTWSVQDAKNRFSAMVEAAPSLAELLLAMPTDDGVFERQTFVPRDIDF